MSFLLKIVQGPNAGAEIALAEGVTLSVGSADTCDIVFSDAAVGARAFELEVTRERVMVVQPGGKTLKLEPYQVTFVGTTALAIGPAEGLWKELVWPKSELPPAEAPLPPAEPEEPETSADPESEPTPRRSFGCLWILLLLLLLLAAGAFWAFRSYPEQSKAYALRSKDYAQHAWTWVRGKSTFYYQKLTEQPPPPPPAETLEEAALACGFALSATAGRVVATGDFATRAERLEATARAYAARPGVTVDFADAESLKSAADELLTLVSDGDVQALKVEGRKLFLSGTVASQPELRRILESLQSDLPKITGADCSEVTVTGVAVAAPPDDDEHRYRVPRLPAERSSLYAAEPAGVMPIIGILTVPYPCLVLENGDRAMEGARFGEYTIEKIEADSVTVNGSDGTFVWRP